MFEVTVLGSGSAGNAAVVSCGGTRLLVDAGLSAKQLNLRLAAAGIESESIDGILLTHEHSDHSRGVAVFCKKNPLPVYANSHTAHVLRQGKLSEYRNWKIFSTGGDFTVGDFTIQSFSVPHDAADPVGFVLHHGNASLGVLTDLGFATGVVKQRIQSVHTLLIETNYDEKLLQQDTRRPPAIKQRIQSRHGHLSNASAAGIVAGNLNNGMRRVILGHLSRDCNRADLAVAAVRSKLEAHHRDELDIFAVEQDTISITCSVG